MTNSQKTVSSISVTIRKLSYDRELFSRAMTHNYRIGFQQSVDPDKSHNAWLYSPEDIPGWDPLTNLNRDLSDEQKTKMRNFMLAKYDEIESQNKAMLDDRDRPENRDNFYKTNGRFKGYWAYKHNLVGEGVVHIQQDGAENFQFGKNPKLAQAVLDRINEWLEQMELRPVANLQFHGDEKGLPHVHFLYWRSNTKTGKAVHPTAQQMKQLQTIIAKEMDEFGFHRATPWSEDATRKRRHEDIFEFKQRQDREAEQVRLIQKYDQTKAELDKVQSQLVLDRLESSDLETKLNMLADQVRQEEARLSELDSVVETLKVLDETEARIDEKLAVWGESQEPKKVTIDQIPDTPPDKWTEKDAQRARESLWADESEFFFRSPEGITARESMTKRVKEVREKLESLGDVDHQTKNLFDLMDYQLTIINDQNVREARIARGVNRLNKQIKTAEKKYNAKIDYMKKRGKKITTDSDQ